MTSYTVGLKLGVRAKVLTIEAEDALVAALKIPAGHFKFLRVWSVKFLHPRGRTRDC
ncbi:hypothetical protein JQ563_49780, partial [Bradyrhizobium liaoningense]|nr:hypothetical protein [Bradyrhizobium liaoningense]